MRPLYAALILACTTTAIAGDWQQFRGPNAGKLEKLQHPLEWDATKNVAWAVAVPGSGWSSPVVLNDRVYLTSAVSESGAKPKGMMAGVQSMGSYRSAKPQKHTFVVTCLSLKDGSSVWSKPIGQAIPPIVHPSNTYATESPATDGERIFTFFATTGSLVAWDADGKELWRKELGNFKSGNGFGSGSSLAVSDGLVFVQYDNDEKSFVAAYKAENGEQAWRDDRPTKTSWSTPIVWTNSKRKELVTCGSGVVTSYEPKSGEVLWRLRGIQSSFSASPAVDGDQIFFGNSGPMSAGPLVAVAAGSEGEIQLDSKFESDKVAWSRTRSGPGMASPVVAKGCLFIPGSNGILNCYDVKSGERLFQKRVSKMGTVAASLWADEDRVFILDENGSAFAFEAGKEFKQVGKNEIKDLFWSTPTIAGNTLLLRGVDKLYCIRN